jgi:hypothetical protein
MHLHRLRQKKNTEGQTDAPPPPPEDMEEDAVPERSEATQEEEEGEEEDDAFGQATYERGAWRPCEVKAAALENLQAEGFLKAGSWRVAE